MKKIAIIGGRLQGTEACYLAKKAGFETIVIDWDEQAPARGLADQFLALDVTKGSDRLITVLKAADWVLPAMENDAVLTALKDLTELHPLRVLFDFDAYAISASKRRSDQLFWAHDIPSPKPYPEGRAPYLAKPVSGSGSHGVTVLASNEAVQQFLAVHEPAEWVIQEYLVGESYSIEVIGNPTGYRTYQITQIHMDEGYDCRKVTSPCAEIEAGLKERFSRLAVQLAQLVNLKGIMDVEVILHEKELKVLEIDARLPSQTPAAVYRSTGVNLLAELCRMFGGDWAPGNGSCQFDLELPTAYEHLVVSKDGTIREQGEHVMAECGPLTLSSYAGSDEVMTDDATGAREQRMTLINSAASVSELEAKRMKIRQALIR